MRERERKQLLSDVEELRRLLADYSTETIVGACTAYWLKRGSIDEVFQDLVSPAKQWSFLLGLMLTSPEPGEPKKFAERTFERAQELLNKIFLAYAWAYFAEPGEVVTEEWIRVREVAMPAFLHYFNKASSPVQSKSSSAFSGIFLHSTVNSSRSSGSAPRGPLKSAAGSPRSCKVRSMR